MTASPIDALWSARAGLPSYNPAVASSTFRVYLIDGYNVIRRVTRLRAAEQAGGLEAGREALLQAIRGSTIVTRSRFHVVFDGTSEGAPSAPSLHANLRIRFARPPQNADAAILANLRSQLEPEACAVVTADRDLAWEARKIGSHVIPPESWFHGLSPAPKRAPAAAAAESKPRASQADIDWGPRAFGDAALDVSPMMGKPASTPQPESLPGKEDRRRIKERRRARHLRRAGR